MSREEIFIVVRYYLIVMGLVQGVGFRRYTRQQAKRYSIVGWVRNNDNGAVEIDAEGLSADMEQFLSAIKKGSNRSKIERIKIIQLHALEGYENFKTRY